MKCPFCSKGETKVVDKRESGDLKGNRRRRECLSCNKRFTTHEKMEGSTITEIRKRDGKLEKFDQSRITEAIWQAAQAVGGSNKKLSQKLSDEVVSILEEKFGGVTSPGVEQIQDIVEKVLVSNGHYKTSKAYILYRQQHQKLRESKNLYVDVQKTVGSYLERLDWRVKENSNEAFSFSGLLLYTAGEVMANYNLNQMYTPAIAEAHKKGYMHVHDLSHGVIGYSFYRNETVVVREKKSKNIFVLALEQLYDLVNSSVEKENGFEIKYTSNYEILDENGWTEIKRVLRHKANKPLISFNTFNGHNMIITTDHPFITLTEVKNTSCPECNSNNIRKTRSRRICKNGLEKDYYRCKSCNLTFNAPIQKPDLSKRQEKRADQINLNNYIITPNFTINSKQKISLRPIDGWFVGLFIAEGYYKKNYLSFEMIAEDSGFQKLLLYLNENKFAYNLSQRSVRNSSGGLQHLQGNVILDVHLNTLPEEMQILFETIRPYAENKNLPIEFMNYGPNFIGSMIAGIIDGDGVVRNDDAWVSRINLRMTSKTLMSQIQFWLETQNINSSICTIDSFGERKINKTIITPRKQLYSLTFFIPQKKSMLFNESLKIDNNFKYSNIVYKKKEYTNLRKIEYIRNDSEYVYDITTNSHTFLCNSVLAHNCAGWSLKNLLTFGFGGVPNKVDAKPATHLRVVVNHMVNFIGCLQMEFAGAQAFNSVDTLLAPFVRTDKLDYKQTKQCMQELIFSLNVPARWGSQYPFSNLTFDLTVPEDMKDEKAIVGGKEQDFTYGDCQKEMDMINKGFLEIMLEGDSHERVFTFPIPTYNLTKDFDWDSENAKLLFEVTAKYGLPYFQNYIGSDLDPSSVRSMCCRLTLDLNELKNKAGHIFGAGDNVGSLGVVTLNINRLGYEAKDKVEFLKLLKKYMLLARDSLEIKRRVVEKNLKNGLMPYTKRYLGTFNNHFSTIGLCGMNEACMNLLGKDITSPEGKQLTIETLNFMRDRCLEFQKETGNLYNLEATPAEGASYRLARSDKKMYPNIITAGKNEPYLTNSTHLPVKYTDDLATALEHQNDIQPLYTGGTILHTFLGERLPDAETCKNLVRKIAENTKLPYFSMTPTFSVCPNHTYIAGEVEKCPECNAETEIFSRVVGYIRPVRRWNNGKQEEFKERKTFNQEKALKEQIQCN